MGGGDIASVVGLDHAFFGQIATRIVAGGGHCPFCIPFPDRCVAIGIFLICEVYH